MTYIPVTVILLNSEPILLLMGMEEEVSKLAAAYCRVWIPGLMIHSIADSICIMLAAMGLTDKLAFYQLGVLPFNAVFCYLFVRVFEWGLEGAALAGALCAVLTLISMCVLARSYHQIREAFYLPSSEMFNELCSFTGLAIPGAIMLFVECANWEILAIFAGLMGTNYLAAEVIIINLAYLLTCVPMGFGIANVIFVGHALGKNLPRTAVSNAKLATWTVAVIGALFVLFLICFAPYIVRIYQPLPEVFTICVPAFQLNAFFFFFDFMQNATSGLIKVTN